MRVLIRADATLESGTGHVMRCAALGIRLQANSSEIHFACAALPAGLLKWLELQNIHVHMLAGVQQGSVSADLRESTSLARKLGGIDLLIVDHYLLDKNWEHGMRPHVRRILVVDDLADRDHDCDALLDQNLRKDADRRYAKRIPRDARQFLGPRYAMLRQEFDDPALFRERDGTLRKLLVFFGGTDPGNQSLKVIDALRLLGDKAPQTTLVLGPAHPDKELVHSQAGDLESLAVIDATDRMSALMSEADLAIGTCGLAAWERCSLGLPSVVVVTAENQREDAEIMSKLGAAINLGDAHTVDVGRWVSTLGSLQATPSLLRNMGAASEALMRERTAALAELERMLLDACS